MNTKRMDILFELGLKYNGDSFIKDDINVHHTEIICDSDKVFSAKIDKIKTELELRSK